MGLYLYWRSRMKKQEIKYKKIDDLIPYARNSRTHSEEQINQLASLIKEFGFRGAILIDGDNGIIAGHGRVLACKKLGLTDIPTVDGSDMTPAQRKAYVIADNKVALNAGWDYEMLNIEFNDLKDEGFDIDLLAFDEKELQMFDAPEDDPIDDIVTDDGNKQLLLIECTSERELDKLFNEMKERGFECKIMN